MAKRKTTQPVPVPADAWTWDGKFNVSWYASICYKGEPSFIIMRPQALTQPEATKIVRRVLKALNDTEGK